MTANGANGETLIDMLAALKTGEMSLDDINDSYATLLTTLPALDPATTVKIANSIWPQGNYPVLPDFLALNADKFQSEVISVDFDDPAVLNQINNWIEENTDGLIQETSVPILPTVNANRPFFFVIRDNATNSILFMGKVMMP